jgi:hypothetical protein
MSVIEVRLDQAADTALEFSERMEGEFGSGLRVEATPLVTAHESLLPRLRATREYANSNGTYTAILANSNVGLLKPGLGFGLMTAGGVAPAIISPRSTPGELHILYLASEHEAAGNETIRPQDIGRVGYEPTDFQRAVLQGINPFQDKEVGRESADIDAGTAGEGGHSMLGLKGLTDQSIRESIVAGRHIVHGLAETPRGIMPVLSRPSGQKPGMLSTKERRVLPEELIVAEGGTSPHIWLVDHPHYRAISTPVEGLPDGPGLVILGLGMVAAKSQLEVGDNALQDELLTIMERI